MKSWRDCSGKNKEDCFRQHKEIKTNIFVIQQLIERDRKHNLSATFMGELWDILNPLIDMVVMVLVFGKMFGTGEAENFPLYVLTGTTIYGLFSAGTTGCLNALFGNKNFLLKTQISKNVYVHEKVLLAFRNFLYSLFIYAFVVALYRVSPSWFWLLVIPDIVLLLMLIIGMGKILAVINVTFADITYFYKIFTLVIFYGSALFYKVDRLSAGMQKIMMINPIYISIAIARTAIMDGQNSNLMMCLVLFIYALSIYIIGSYYFNKVSEDIVAKMQ